MVDDVDSDSVDLVARQRLKGVVIDPALFQRHVERWIDAGLEVELNQLVGGLRRSPDGRIEIDSGKAVTTDAASQGAGGPSTSASAIYVAALVSGNHRASGTRNSHVGSKYISE